MNREHVKTLRDVLIEDRFRKVHGQLAAPDVPGLKPGRCVIGVACELAGRSPDIVGDNDDYELARQWLGLTPKDIFMIVGINDRSDPTWRDVVAYLDGLLATDRMLHGETS